MNEQPDLFGPLHEELLREANFYYEKAKPLMDKYNELKAKAFAACPHDEIQSQMTQVKDEFDRWTDTTEYRVKCLFCGKTNWISYVSTSRNRKPEKTDLEILLMERVDKYYYS